MIKIKDGQITDILPCSMAKEVEMQCISYALHKQIQRVLELADKTRTVAMIDLLPERILDILAVELRTPYYQEDMNIETKRNIIKRTLLWHTKAGTPSAVEELIEIVFGDGSVVEWFNYDEPPYTPGTFDIVTNAQMTEEITEYFLMIIQRVKNTRSHIRRILINRDIHMDERVATGVFSHPEDTILNHHKGISQADTKESVGAAITASPERYATNSPQGRTQALERADRAAVVAFGSPIIHIGNYAAPATVSAGHKVCMATVAYAYTERTISNGALQRTVEIKAKQRTAAAAAGNSTITI